MSWLARLLAALRPSPAVAAVPVAPSFPRPAAAPPTVTTAQLRALFPRLANLEAWAEALAPAMARRGITGPVRSAAFLAQIGHESAGLSRLVESLDYAAERLVPVFGAHRITPAQAAALGRKLGRPAQQEAIANLVYGGAWGRLQLGNIQLDDGWRFRGRGAIQVTGRANYTACAEALGVPLPELPAYLETPRGAAEAAAWFWERSGCNALADAGDLAALTRRINGGLTGLADRESLYAQARTLLAA